MKHKDLLTFILLALILIFAFGLRRDAFWLPHWKGDQSHYAALAMKLDKQGLDGYSLREVRLGAKIIPQDPKIELIFCRPAVPGDEGDILRVLKIVGQGYYDEPLHYRAPLFSYVLMLSHRLFAGHEEFYANCVSNLGEKVRSIKPEIVLRAQFWAAVVPIFLNLCVIAMTFWFGWRFFGSRIGLWAAFLMATNPVSIMLSYRLLVEDLLTFFILLSAGLYLIFWEKKNYWGIFAAGIAAGLAILSKQTAGLFLAAVWMYTYLTLRRKKSSVANIFDLRFLIFAAAAFLVSGFWFWKVYSILGNPLHTPGSVNAGFSEDMTGWFRTVSQRPPPVLFFSLGVVFLSPLFAFSFLTLPRTWREQEGVRLMLWCWILPYFIFATEAWQILELSAGQEHRFFYMAYPALAILAALGMDLVRQVLRRKVTLAWLPDLAVIVLLFWNAWRGIPQVMKVIYQNNMLF